MKKSFFFPAKIGSFLVPIFVPFLSFFLANSDCQIQGMFCLFPSLSQSKTVAAAVIDSVVVAAAAAAAPEVLQVKMIHLRMIIDMTTHGTNCFPKVFRFTIFT